MRNLTIKSHRIISIFFLQGNKTNTSNRIVTNEDSLFFVFKNSTSFYSTLLLNLKVFKTKDEYANLKCSKQKM